MGEDAKTFNEESQRFELNDASGFSFYLTRAVWFGFLLLVFSLAFLTPSIHIKYQKLAATDFLFLVVFALWLICLAFRLTNFRRHRFYGFLAFYFAAMLGSTIFSPELPRSIVKLAGETYLLALAVLAFNLVRSEKGLKQVIFAWLAGTLGTAAVGAATILLFYLSPQNWLLEYTTSIYGAVPVGNYPRLQSTFVSASMLCNYLTVSLAMLFIAERAKFIGKIVFISLYAAISVCMIFTISSGLGGVVLFIGVWYWIIYRETRKVFARLSLTGAMASAFLFSGMNFIALAPYSTAPFSIVIPFSEAVLYPSPRFLVWIDALKTFKENFFFGNGLGRPVCAVLFHNTDGNFSLLTDAHNIFINVAAQNGIFGLLAISAIAVYFLRQIFRLKTPKDFTAIASAGLLLAFFSSFIFQGLSGSFEDARYLWVLIGVILATSQNSER